MRNLYGFVNVDEQRYFETLKEQEFMNNKLQLLGVYQVAIEFKQISINRWKWVQSLPSEYINNPLFIENIEEELRQEALQMFEKQKEMGMDNTHLEILWSELTK